MDITPLQNHEVDYIWHKVKDYFEAVAKTTHGRFTGNDIREKLKTTNQQLWIAHEGEDIYGFVITGFATYPQMKCLVLLFTAGKEFSKWQRMILDELEKYARVNGCDSIEFFGRKAWSKVFKEEGYKPMYTFYELSLGDANV